MNSEQFSSAIAYRHAVNGENLLPSEIVLASRHRYLTELFEDIFTRSPETVIEDLITIYEDVNERRGGHILPAEVVNGLIESSLLSHVEDHLLILQQQKNIEDFVYYFDALLGIRLLVSSMNFACELVYKDPNDVIDDALDNFIEVEENRDLLLQAEAQIAFNAVTSLLKTLIQTDVSGKSIVDVFVENVRLNSIDSRGSSLPVGIHEYVQAGALLYQKLYYLAYQLYIESFPPDELMSEGHI